MRERLSGLISEDHGAVAPTVALSLFALIAAGGIAFDYARVATLDTELQNAADQAALAAAGQLDGDPNACARASAAAVNLVQNRTVMANDSGAPLIAITPEPTCDSTGMIRFWQDKAKTQPATSDANAKFVEVQTASRTGRYTLTPVVAAFTGATIYGQAFAGIGSAICRVPPLMMCNPNETSDPTDEDFLIANFAGRGIRLVANDGGGGYGPGNFGFLDTGYDGGANGLRQVLGRTAPPGDCVAEDGVTTQPGAMLTVLDALNTRFDIYHGDTTQACSANGSLCAPSANTRKDVLKGGAGGENNCAFQPGNGNVGWKIPPVPYLPPSNAALTQAQAEALSPMGYPRDICHAVSNEGSCTFNGVTPNRIGDRNWDRYAYFRSNRGVNYPEITTTTTNAQIDALMQGWFGTTTPTRYQVYEWEMRPANAPTRLAARDDPNGGNGANARTSYGAPVCTTPGVAPSATQIDRRILSAAVVNCTEEGVAGRTTGVAVKHWIDIFLVEPSLPRDRTEASDVYIEVIGETENATGAGAVQAIKKSVPYLIE